MFNFKRFHHFKLGLRSGSHLPGLSASSWRLAKCDGWMTADQSGKVWIRVLDSDPDIQQLSSHAPKKT
jgi:hypothetical protein